MPITTLSSRDQQRQRSLFVDFFVKEFMAEMHYLEEMARGNQQARKNGDDEAYERLFNLACGLASLVPHTRFSISCDCVTSSIKRWNHTG